MLILTRKIGQSIIIGKDSPDIKITILHKINSAYFRVGIEAPKMYNIWRKEVYDREGWEGLIHESVKMDA